MNAKEIAEKNKILKIKVGSQLYGTNTETSDTDYSGIYVGGEDEYFGIFRSKEEDLSIESKDNEGKNTADALDYKLYEIKKFMTLASSNNPNIIEFLFVNDKNIEFINDLGRHLLHYNYIFPHKGAYDKFIGYANSQKHKMIIKLEHFDQLRDAKEFFSTQDPHEYIVTFRGDVRLRTFFKEKGSHFIIGDLNFQKHLMVKKVLSTLNLRLDSITNRSELVLKYGYDTKFASHLIRLLFEGERLLRTGKLEFPLPEVQLILNIKTGGFELKELLSIADKLEKNLLSAKEKSKLPEEPDMNKINNLTKEISMGFYNVGN